MKAPNVASVQAGSPSPAEHSSLGDGDYRSLVDGLEEGVVHHDHHGTIRACNPSAERILGVGPSALLGRASVLELCQPVDVRGAPFSLKSCPALVSLRSGRSCRNVVIGVKEPGGVRWLNLSSHPLVSQEGKLSGVVTSFSDITEARRREDTAERQIDEAKLRIKLHDDFLATAAHELKTPLTALMLQVQSLHASVNAGASLQNERVTHKLKSTVRHAERLNVFINLLLDATRITVGQLDIVRHELDLARLVEEVVVRHAEQLSQSGCEVHLNTQSVTGQWDGPRLEQVVSNLLNNALKYGEAQPVRILVGPETGGARLEITDLGPGIAPTDHQRVFERFERLSGGAGKPGLGLGLWICRQIVQAHGGKIELRSVPGAGATFSVWLPKVRAA